MTSDNEISQLLELTSCEVKCPNCNTVWNSSLDSDEFNCLICNTQISPKLHVVVESEKEIQ